MSHSLCVWWLGLCGCAYEGVGCVLVAGWVVGFDVWVCGFVGLWVCGCLGLVGNGVWACG